VYWSKCAVKGPLFQQVEVLPRQRSSQPGTEPNGSANSCSTGQQGMPGATGFSTSFHRRHAQANSSAGRSRRNRRSGSSDHWGLDGVKNAGSSGGGRYR
jgi:hypothetical protein